jgi:hypothetical protein
VNVGGRIGVAIRSIEDLWVSVRERFASDPVLKGVEFRCGHQYLEEWEGVNRVVFVQDDPEISPAALRQGEIGSMTDACRAHVWAVDLGKDYGADQGIAAKSLAVDLYAAAYLSYSGMVTGGLVEVAASTHVLKYGEKFVMRFRLKCPIEAVTGERALHIGGAETRA